MDFFIPKLLWLLLRPSTVLVLGVAAGAALLLRRPAGRGRWLLALSAGMLALCVVLPVDALLLLPLESRFSRPQPAPARVDGIVVLGGAVETYLTEQHGTPALNGSAERMTAFVALARQYPSAQLAFTGGSGRLEGSRLSEAEVASRLFAQLGLVRPVVYEDRSRTTHENAVMLKAIVRPQPGKSWLLVTSAAHMPRAVGSFRRAGWPVLAWPVGYRVGRHPRFDLEQGLPDRLGGIDSALHEWVGLIAYYFLGRTDVWLPGPS